MPDPQGERIIARITNIHKENPLLSRDQAGVSASLDVKDLGFEFSRRFTYGWAHCTVIGTLTHHGLDMNLRGIAPNAQVHTPSVTTLRQLFFHSQPSYVPLGSIETFGEQDIAEVPVTLDADQLVTKHFCVFGMTGSGKTNTAAKLLEELMARGHRTVIFDSHDDYQGLEDFSHLFRDKDNDGQEVTLKHVEAHKAAVQHAIQLLQPTASEGRELAQCVYERLLRTASVIYNNTPARQFLKPEMESLSTKPINPEFVNQIAQTQPWSTLMRERQMESHRCFPELRNYGSGFQDFTINLLEAFRGEPFTAAQWRWLRQNIGQPGTGIQYLQNLWRVADTQLQRVRNNPNSGGSAQSFNVLTSTFNSLQTIYQDALTAGAHSLDMETFFKRVADRKGNSAFSVYRLSLTDLSSNLRKAMIYAVVTYFFRSFKFGGYRVQPTDKQKPAYPVVFVLEEARALIPKSSGSQDEDAAATLSRRAMRELAYEGRKFSLGFGLVSQKPSTVDPEVVSQSNTFILHQLKSPDDQQYVRAVTESMSQDELDMIKSLGTGRAIVAGMAVTSPVLLRVYQRYSQEGIKEPTPILDELGSVQDIRKNLSIGDE